MKDLIERIEAKAEHWRGRPIKMYADAEPMHPYSVLRMLANELREEAELPLETRYGVNADGVFRWIKVTP